MDDNEELIFKILAEAKNLQSLLKNGTDLVTVPDW